MVNVRCESTSRSSHRGCSVEKVFLEISQNSQENKVYFLIKACNFIKNEAMAQVRACEFCEISKNIFFKKIPPVAISVSLIIPCDKGHIKQQYIFFYTLETRVKLNKLLEMFLIL